LQVNSIRSFLFFYFYIIKLFLKDIIAEQFQKLKYGDRFFYQNDKVFKREQLNNILQTTMAEIICENSIVTEVQPDPFRLSSVVDGTFKNSVRPCSSYSTFNINLWKNNIDSNHNGSRPPKPNGGSRRPPPRK
jgi:hypothetical protein